VPANRRIANERNEGGDVRGRARALLPEIDAQHFPRAYGSHGDHAAGTVGLDVQEHDVGDFHAARSITLHRLVDKLGKLEVLGAVRRGRLETLTTAANCHTNAPCATERRFETRRSSLARIPCSRVRRRRGIATKQASDE
jgi:hypothetical protein